MDGDVNGICVADLVERQTSEVLEGFRSGDDGKTMKKASVLRRWMERCTGLRLGTIGLLAAIVVASGLARGADGGGAGGVEFERDVWPVFVSRCHKCHAADKQRGG